MNIGSISFASTRDRKNNGTFQASFEDVNGDGRLDPGAAFFDSVTQSNVRFYEATLTEAPRTAAVVSPGRTRLNIVH